METRLKPGEAPAASPCEHLWKQPANVLGDLRWQCTKCGALTDDLPEPPKGGVKTNTGTYCGNQMPTPHSETEEVGYEVKHLEPLRCQEYEDEIRALREALEKVGDVAALVLASSADIAMAEIRDIARTAIDQAKSPTKEVP